MQAHSQCLYQKIGDVTMFVGPKYLPTDKNRGDTGVTECKDKQLQTKQRSGEHLKT